MAEESSLILNVQSDSVTNASKRLRTFAQDGEKAEKSVVGLSGQSVKTGTSLGKISDGGTRASRSLTDVSRESKKTKDSLFSVEKASDSAKRSIQGMIVGAVGITAITAAVAVTTREWLSYDKAIKEVNSITSQSASEFRTMRKDVLNLSVALGVDATKAARGLYQTLSSGIPKENAIAFLATASKAAIAGVTDVGTAVDGLTNTINAFKIPVNEAESVADKLFSTVVQGKTTFEELSQNMSKASVPAAALGVDLDELLGVIVGITKQGTPTSEAFTQVKAAIQALNDPSDQMVAVFQQMGVESGRAAVAQFGLVETLSRVEMAYRGNDAALVKALRSSEAFNGVLSVTGRNLESTKTAIDGVTNSSGQMGGAFAENANTLENSLSKIKAQAISLVEQMESSFGVIQSFTELLSNASLAMSQFANTDVSQATQSAMSFGGGVMGASAISGQIAELEKLKKTQQKAFDDYYANDFTGLRSTNPMGIGDFFAGKGDLQKTIREIEQLKKAYSEIPPVVKETQKSLSELQETQNSFDAGLITAERKLELDRQTNSQLDIKVDTYKILEEQESKAQKVLEDGVKAQQERSKIAAEQLAREKKDEKELAAAKKKSGAEEKRVTEQQIKRANDLATTDKERIQLEIKKIDALKQAGQIDSETHTKAKANLLEQIKLLEERNNKIPKAKAVGASKSASSASGGGSSQSLPDLYDPFQSNNEFDELDRQVEYIRKSYEERKAVILSITSATEDEKLQMIQDSQNKYMELMGKADKERNTIRLNLAADFFGNLSQIASAFGAKGAKVAKAAAITQTIIKTYESATSAYASLAGIPYIGPALGAAAAGAAIAAGFANVQAIRSQPVDAGAYATGGIVGGNNRSGDNMQARVNSGEMILNLGQQANLLNIASGKESPRNGQSSQPIVNVNVRTLPGTTAEVKQNPNNPEQLEIIIRKVDEAMASNLQTGGGKFVPALTRKIPALKQAT